MSHVSTTRVAVACLLAMVVPWPEASAQSRNGTYAGMIQCDALPAQRPLKTKVSMTVADGRARYEREILTSTGAPSGIFERGEGPVAPSGEVTLTTRAAAPGYSYEAEYRGQIGEGSARLTGTQRWKIQRESGTLVRPCSLELMRAPQ
jgi:hypothetical protein